MPKLPTCSICEEQELPEHVRFARLKTLYQRKNMDNGKRKFVKTAYAVCGIFPHHLFMFINEEWRRMGGPIMDD